MICRKCKGEWNSKNSVSKFCPFCGAELVENAVQEDGEQNFTTSAEALGFVYRKYGAEVLLDKKLSAYISDYAPDLSDEIKWLIKTFYDVGASDSIKAGINGSVDDRTAAVNKAVSRLTNRFIDIDTAVSITNEFAAALGWDTYDAGTVTNNVSPKKVTVKAVNRSHESDAPKITDESQADFIRQTYRLAQNGNVTAQLEIGKRFYEGKGIEPDGEEAVKWFNAAASQGNAEAMYMLGECYYSETSFPIGGELDEKSKENYNKAFDSFVNAVILGNTAAKYRMGYCYEYGKGTKEDIKEAVIWYRRAAQDGYAKAQNKLGDCYMNGRGVTSKNYIEALKWYKKAAEQGDEDAQLTLGNYYRRDYNDDHDIHEAIKWYKLVAMNEKSTMRNIAQSNLGDIYSDGYYITPDNKEAFKWYKMAAINGISYDKTRFGDIYLKGELGVKKDFHEAQKWYDEAGEKIRFDDVVSFAESGDQYAQFELGKRYYFGNGAALDYSAAFKLFKKSADSGNVDAMYYLGLCYYYGNGVPQNVGNATTLIKTAAAYGQEEAKEMLG